MLKNVYPSIVIRLSVPISTSLHQRGHSPIVPDDYETGGTRTNTVWITFRASEHFFLLEWCFPTFKGKRLLSVNISALSVILRNAFETQEKQLPRMRLRPFVHQKQRLLTDVRIRTLNRFGKLIFRTIIRMSLHSPFLDLAMKNGPYISFGSPCCGTAHNRINVT